MNLLPALHLSDLCSLLNTHSRAEFLDSRELGTPRHLPTPYMAHAAGLFPWLLHFGGCANSMWRRMTERNTFVFSPNASECCVASSLRLRNSGFSFINVYFYWFISAMQNDGL